MPTETVLVQVVTAANMAGIEEAKAGMLGLSMTTLGLAAVLGVALVVGKAAVENFKKQEEATNQLKQATDAQHISLSDLQKAYEVFKTTNAGFITDQYDTETALAAVVRSGENQTDALRILNDALDLSAIKHETVSEAGLALVKVLAGNSRALKELGITTEQYNAIMHDKLLTTEEKHQKLLDLIETKTKSGREVVDQMAQSQNKLNLEWQDFTARLGPPIVALLIDIVTAATTALKIFDLLGQAIQRVGQSNLGQLVNAAQQLNPGLPQIFGRRAKGGPVAAGEAYTVGEQGPETLVMGNQGGNIVPNGAGGATEIHIHIEGGLYADGPGLDRFTNAIAQRLRFVSGT